MKRTTDILTVEIGSTITKINAFNDGKKVGGAFDLTTPSDVMIGYNRALGKFNSETGISIDGVGEIFVLSSAAGGLRMTVHGLTRELTARAAEEAALGAGANINFVTAGLLKERDLKKIKSFDPNIIMIAGGVEFGEEDTVYENSKVISEGGFECPVIYAGNATLADEIKEMFKNSSSELFITENVYPGFDELNIGPVRSVIQNIFSENLAVAPGIDGLKKMSENIIPVPGACLKAAEVLASVKGDLAVIDVGGATTDVYSIVNTPSVNNLEIQVPSRRTVEGDLGLFVSAGSVWKAIGEEGVPEPLSPLPETFEEKEVSKKLCEKSVEQGLIRHSGRIIHGAYLSGGAVSVTGQDLRNVNLVVGTGGGLSGLDNGVEIINDSIGKNRNNSLLSSPETLIKIDRDYIFSACGAFSDKYPETAIEIIKNSLGI